MGFRLVSVFLDVYCKDPGPEWETLLRLCEDAPNETGLSSPGWEVLAGYRSRRTVVRHLAELEAKGWISIQARPAKGRVTTYRVLPDHYVPTCAKTGSRSERQGNPT
jgi:hypothetical protein